MFTRAEVGVCRALTPTEASSLGKRLRSSPVTNEGGIPSLSYSRKTRSTKRSGGAQSLVLEAALRGWGSTLQRDVGQGAALLRFGRFAAFAPAYLNRSPSTCSRHFDCWGSRDREDVPSVGGRGRCQLHLLLLGSRRGRGRGVGTAWLVPACRAR